MVLDLVRSEIHPFALGSLPRWSPDGQKLLFLRAPETRSAPASIWVIGADRIGERKVADTRSLIPSATWALTEPQSFLRTTIITDPQSSE